MPHQCVRCGTLYEDGDRLILKGCNCGAKLFFFIKPEALRKSRETVDNLTSAQIMQIENDVRELIGRNNLNDTVVLDIESIKITEPGKYELDIIQLFKGSPVVYKIEDGKYVIDVAESFKKGKINTN